MLLIVNFGGKIYPLWNVVMNKEIIGKYVMWCFIFIVLIAVSFNSCSWIYEKFDIPDDNPIEEMIEQVIEHQTGITLDMTPESKEK